MTDAKIERGDEHPSGLRWAILHGMTDWEADDDAAIDVQVDYIEASVLAWLSVVSEREIEAAARRFCDNSTEYAPWDSAPEGVRQACREIVAEILAASRGVLLPKETPGPSYSAGSPSMKEHP